MSTKNNPLHPASPCSAGLVVVACFAVTCCVSASEWTQFRGPDGQGHAAAKGLPLDWTGTQNIVWSTPLPGLGWSSPVVVDGRIFLTTAVPAKSGSESGQQSLRALCLSAETGMTQWDVEVFTQQSGTAIHSKNSHASPTPITDGQNVFVHFGTHGTACLTVDGEIVWKNRELNYRPIHGNGGSPVLFDDLVIVICDGSDATFVAGLDRANGEVRWRTDRDVDAAKRFSFSTPLLIEVQGEPQVVCPGSGIVAAYRPRTGEEIWRVEYPGGYSVIPRPVFGHGLVYVCTGYNTPTLLAIRPDGRGNITETHVQWRSDKAGWKAKGAVPHTSSLLLHGDNLYFVSDKGIASCVNALTGRAYWQNRLGGNFSASPILAEDRIYFQSEEGETIVVRADRQFDEVARNRLMERTLASPAVIGSALLLRTDERLIRIEQR